MPYTPDATAVTQPDGATVKASTAAAEFQAIKLYMRDVLLAGLAAKAPLASPAFTGTVTAVAITATGNISTSAQVGAGSLAVTGAAAFSTSPTAPTPAPADNSTKAATTAYVDAAILAAVLAATLPSQAGNKGKFAGTDGSVASWEWTTLKKTEVNAASAACALGENAVVTYAGICALAAPVATADGQEFAVSISNGRRDATLDFGAATLQGIDATFTGVITMDTGGAWRFKWLAASSKWIIVN